MWNFTAENGTKCISVKITLGRNQVMLYRYSRISFMRTRLLVGLASDGGFNSKVNNVALDMFVAPKYCKIVLQDGLLSL